MSTGCGRCNGEIRFARVHVRGVDEALYIGICGHEETPLDKMYEVATDLLGGRPRAGTVEWVPDYYWTSHDGDVFYVWSTSSGNDALLEKVVEGKSGKWVEDSDGVKLRYECDGDTTEGIMDELHAAGKVLDFTNDSLFRRMVR